jgi:hypothetical protein
MTTVDYKRHERLRRNARLAYADAILSDAEARCAAMDRRTPIDPYELLLTLLDDEIERFKDVCESILEGCSADDVPQRPVHAVFEEIRDWALRRPLRGEEPPPLPMPGQLRLPSAGEIASSDPLTDTAGPGNI